MGGEGREAFTLCVCVAQSEFVEALSPSVSGVVIFLVQTVLRLFDVLSSLALVVADTTPPWASTASACRPTAHA